MNWIFSIYDADDGGRFQKNTIFSFIHNYVYSIDVVEIMDLVLGLFKISKMEEDMDKIVACVQVQCFILKECLQYYNNQKMILYLDELAFTLLQKSEEVNFFADQVRRALGSGGCLSLFVVRLSPCSKT